MSSGSAMILALGIVIGAALFGGRYTAVTVRGPNDGHGLVYIVDRFTGSTKWCQGFRCGEGKIEP